MGICWATFTENIQDRVFQHGDSIILHHGALVNSSLMDSGPDKLDFKLFGLLEMSMTPKPVIVDVASAESLQNPRKCPEPLFEYIKSIRLTFFGEGRIQIGP